MRKGKGINKSLANSLRSKADLVGVKGEGELEGHRRSWKKMRHWSP